MTSRCIFIFLLCLTCSAFVYAGQPEKQPQKNSRTVKTVPDIANYPPPVPGANASSAQTNPGTQTKTEVTSAPIVPAVSTVPAVPASTPPVSPTAGTAPVSPAAGAAPAPDNGEKKATRKSFTVQYMTRKKIRYVHLENVADFYQLSMSFPKKKQIVLSSDDTKIEMYTDKRDGKINNVTVYFTEPVLILNNRVYITENDFLRVIDPVLRTRRLKKLPVLTVMLDPGHGGSDSGAPGPVMQEKQINLIIARKLAAILKKNGIRVLMTRSGDSFPTLAQRSGLCKKYKPDLFISIHNNASTNSTSCGIETYLPTPSGAASSNDSQVKHVSFETNNFDQNNFRLAYEIQKQLIQTTKAEDRGVRHARFFVLKNSAVPSVLVECGYLSNKQEGRKLADNQYQNKLAVAIATGIFRYIKLTEPEKEQ